MWKENIKYRCGMSVADASQRKTFWLVLERFLRLFLGLALLALSLWKVDWGGLVYHLVHAQCGWLVIALLSVLVSSFMKILRWRWLLLGLGIQREPGFLRLGGAFFIGQAVNILFPLRAGELARVGWLSVNDQQDAFLTAFSVLLEKYFDLVILLGLVTWLGPVLPVEALITSRSWLVPLCAGATLTLVVGLWAAPFLWERISQRWPKRWAGLAERIESWVSSLRLLRSGRRVLTLMVFSVLLWGVMLSTNLFVLQALSLPVDLRTGGLVLVLVYLGLAPALMPGNVGPFYYLAMLALAPFGIGISERAAFAVLLHAIVVLPPLFLGGAFLGMDRWKKRGRK